MAADKVTPPEDSGPPSDAPLQRRLGVIMFTDLVGYSALTQRDEPLALRLLEEHRAIVRPLLAQHGGREIKTIGDAFLVEFSSAFAAAACAIAIQQAFHEQNLTATPDHRILLRIGLHAGDIIHKGNDVFGDGVNIAARIEPLAEPGGICVSEDVARQIQNKAAYPLAKLGTGELKNIAMPVDIYRVLLPWTKARLPLAARLSFLLRKKSIQRTLLAGAAGLVLLAALLFRSTVKPVTPAPANRLAVLPMVNFSGDARDEYFADGMTEELISSLATVRELDVIARTSITKFKGARLDIAEIGKALSVGSILEGTIRMAGEQARIDVRLVDVASQKTIWSQEYSRLIKDVFAVQSAIAQSVTDALKVQLLTGEKKLIERRGTENSEAYRQYLLGRSHLNKRTGDEVMKAIENFSRSAELDPGFALTYAGLAECYTLAGSAGYGTLPRTQSNDRAREFAVKAVTLDESLAEAHASLGYVKFRADWDWQAAETEFKRALELKPGYARAHEWYALYLSIQRRFAEAMAEMRRAQQLDPLSTSVSNGIGRILHFQRQYDDALLQFRKTLELEPQYAEAFFSLGMTYQAMHRYDDALAAYQTAIPLSGNRPVMIAMLGMAEGLAGRKDEARKTYDDMLALARTTKVSPYYFGIISIGLGDADQAFQFFEQAYAEREGILIYLAVDPITDSVSSDPRFGALMGKLGLKR